MKFLVTFFCSFMFVQKDTRKKKRNIPKTFLFRPKADERTREDKDKEKGREVLEIEIIKASWTRVLFGDGD
jgi:hypothetical protein